MEPHGDWVVSRAAYTKGRILWHQGATMVPSRVRPIEAHGIHVEIWERSHSPGLPSDSCKRLTHSTVCIYAMQVESFTQDSQNVALKPFSRNALPTISQGRILLTTFKPRDANSYLCCYTLAQIRVVYGA